MKTVTKMCLRALISLLFIGCNSSDCNKEIVIEERTILTPSGSSYIPSYQLTVPCDYVIPPLEEQVRLKEFSYEVVQFVFTPDTGRNTARLQYQIKLNNLSNQQVKGFPILTTDADGIVVAGGYRSTSCEQLEANSSCIVTYDKEFAINVNVGFTKSVKLVKVEYYITK